MNGSQDFIMVCSSFCTRRNLLFYSYANRVCKVEVFCNERKHTYVHIICERLSIQFCYHYMYLQTTSTDVVELY